MKEQRSSASVGRGDDAKSAPAIGRAETLLGEGRLDPPLAGAEPQPEHMRPVRPRCVLLAVSAGASRGRPLELACLDQAGAPHRPVAGQPAAVNVGDDLGIGPSTAREGGARCQAVLIETLEGPEPVRQRVRPILHIEGEPDLLIAAALLMALPGSAHRDHRGRASWTPS